MMRKAQIQAISLVLVSGIVVSLAGVVYFWGKPLMDKRSAMTDVGTAEAFIVQLDKEIISVARNKGEKTVDIPGLTASLLKVDEANNRIVYRFIVAQPMMKMGDEQMAIPVESRHIETVGIYGESPRIITLEGIEETGQYMMLLNLTYRTLVAYTDPPVAYKIVLEEIGTGGNDQVTVSYRGTEVGVGEAPTDPPGDLLKTMIGVKIS